MRRTTAWLLLFLVLTPLCPAAPVGMGLRMAHVQFLKFEPTIAYLQIENRLTDEIAFGREPGQSRIEIEIQQLSGRKAKHIRSEPIFPPFVLNGGERRTLRVDLSRWYDLSATGRYVARAMVERKGKRFICQAASFDVVRGMELTRLQRHLSGYDDLERIYSVRYLARGAAEVVFLCVDEIPSGLNYGVFRLGNIIRLFRPTIEMNTRGRVTVTHQSRPYGYTRTVFLSSRHKVYRVDQSYHLPDGRPYPFAGSRRGKREDGSAPPDGRDTDTPAPGSSVE